MLTSIAKNAKGIIMLRYAKGRLRLHPILPKGCMTQSMTQSKS